MGEICPRGFCPWVILSGGNIVQGDIVLEPSLLEVYQSQNPDTYLSKSRWVQLDILSMTIA